MVIIITGATHTGKTRLAQKLMERLHVPYVCQDHIKMGLIRSGNTSLTPDDDDLLTSYLWPITREMIKTVIENDQNLIVEGCYVPFDWKEDFNIPLPNQTCPMTTHTDSDTLAMQQPRSAEPADHDIRHMGSDSTYLDHIKYICLCLSEQYIRAHFDDITAHASCIEHRVDDEYCTQDLLIRENRRYLEGCKAHGLPYVLIEDDYQLSVDNLLKRIP